MTSNQSKSLPEIAPYGPNAIEVDDLTFTYDQKSGTFILNHLNLELKTGSRCLLIGANGSGKSSLCCKPSLYHCTGS